jgi:hypothetical protein
MAEDGLYNVGCWLRANLLTLNSTKTKYIQFHLSKINLVNFTLNFHSCTLSNKTNCSCPIIEKTNQIKYLGVILDENINWRSHINLIASRQRKLIWAFKRLRCVADFDLLRNIYYSLSRSILSYCICVWGGACKTFMINLERSQRSLLKVMTFSPLRFPTKLLYEKCEILTVRQLYILHLLLKQHKATPYDKKTLNKRTTVGICKLPKVRTAFARRQHTFFSKYLYRKVNKKVDFYPLTLRDAKFKIRKWLLTLSYEQTESLLNN